MNTINKTPQAWDKKLRAVWTTRSGYGAVVLQLPIGQFCGYVMVPKGHPAYGARHKPMIRRSSISCHGGITYAEFNNNPDCPYPVPQTEKDAYWIGFDCGHFGDGRDPEMLREYLTIADGAVREQTIQLLSQGHIWTVDEVVAECESIATQLKEMAR